MLSVVAQPVAGQSVRCCARAALMQAGGDCCFLQPCGETSAVLQNGAIAKNEMSCQFIYL